MTTPSEDERSEAHPPEGEAGGSPTSPAEDSAEAKADDGEGSHGPPVVRARHDLPSRGSSAGAGLPRIYESAALAAIRDKVSLINASYPKFEVSSMLGSIQALRDLIGTSGFSNASLAAHVFGSPPGWSTIGSSLAGSSVAELFARPAWHSEVVGVSSLLAGHRMRLSDIAMQIDTVLPKFDHLDILPELRASVLLGNQAFAIAADFAPSVPDLVWTSRLLDAGRTTLGMSTTGLLMSSPDDEELVDDLLDDGDDELVAGPADVRRRLRAALSGLDPDLLNRLDGAWERVSHHGPDAASQAANSMVELIDWTLRWAAPNDRVTAWHTEGSRPPDELIDGRPTRALKVRFIVRDRPDAAAAEMYVKGITELLKLLQGHKHGSGDHELAAVGRLLPTVEASLAFLLL